MKKYLLITILFVSSDCFSQTNHYQYSYDNAGNRIKREYFDYSQRQLAPIDSSKKEVAIKRGLNVFPNPTSGQVNISISELADNEKAFVLLFDEQGKLLFTKEQNSKQDFIDLQRFATGFYFLKVQIGEDVLEYKIQKME